MKINYKRFPILKLIKEKANSPFIEMGLDAKYEQQVRSNLDTINEFWKFLIDGIHDGTAHIDYITEPIRKLVDDDFKVGDKLYRERDNVHDASGIFLSAPKFFGFAPMGLTYCYHFVTDPDNHQTYFTTLLAGSNMVMAFEMGLFKHNDFPKVYLTKDSFNKALLYFIEKSLRIKFMRKNIPNIWGYAIQSNNIFKFQ